MSGKPTSIDGDETDVAQEDEREAHQQPSDPSPQAQSGRDHHQHEERHVVDEALLRRALGDLRHAEQTEERFRQLQEERGIGIVCPHHPQPGEHDGQNDELKDEKQRPLQFHVGPP
jgi:hypothetical protein